jgi:hypothetical protein
MNRNRKKNLKLKLAARNHFFLSQVGSLTPYTPLIIYRSSSSVFDSITKKFKLYDIKITDSVS